MAKVATVKIIVATRITNINNSISMISMRANWHHFYIGLVCQNCLAHSVVLALMTLSMALSNFVKDSIKHDTLGC